MAHLTNFRRRFTLLIYDDFHFRAHLGGDLKFQNNLNFDKGDFFFNFPRNKMKIWILAKNPVFRQIRTSFLYSEYECTARISSVVRFWSAFGDRESTALPTRLFDRNRIIRSISSGIWICENTPNLVNLLLKEIACRAKRERESIEKRSL